MEKFYTCDEVAERFGVKVTTVWCWIRDKNLPALKFGKNYRVKATDIEEFEKAHRTVPDSGESEESEN